MAKHIIGAVVLIGIVVVIGSFAFIRRAEAPALSAEELIAAKEEAWSLYETYLTALNEKDRETVRSLSYQLTDACKDDAKKDECDVIMRSAHEFGTTFTKEDLVNIAGDGRQTILFGDYRKDDVATTSSALIRPIVYFVRTEEGLKFLSLSPFDGVYIHLSDENRDGAAERLQALTIDTDMDTLSDEAEKCLINAPMDCAKTSPFKKDSDGDGWWDSIEAKFYR
jgi:hypothetical protein